MKRILIAVLYSLCFFSNADAQGCSDAGFCTAGAMQGGRSVTDSSRPRGSFGASVTAGAGEKGTSIVALQLEGKFVLPGRSYVDVKLPFNFSSGNLGSHSGVGDIITTYSHLLTASKATTEITGTIGGRIGVGNANATDRGMPLPMPYQNSLGTTDIIVGLGLVYHKYVSIAAGYQQPVIQYNKNGYLPDIIYPDMPTSKEYFASRNLDRRGDVLLRAEGHYQWKKWTVFAGPLFIYHLGEDRFTTQSGDRASLKGSEGMTLNVAGSLSYSLPSGKIDLLGGTPFIVRDYRPDGLTRAWVITLRYTQFH